MMKVEQFRAALAVAQERFDAAITAAALAELQTFEKLTGETIPLSSRPLGTKVKPNPVVSNNSKSIRKRLWSQRSV